MLALSHDLRWKAGSGVNVTDVGLRLQAGGWSQCASAAFLSEQMQNTNPNLLLKSSVLLSSSQGWKEAACWGNKNGRQTPDSVLVYNVQHLAEVNSERQRPRKQIRRMRFYSFIVCLTSCYWWDLAHIDASGCAASNTQDVCHHFSLRVRA